MFPQLATFQYQNQLARLEIGGVEREQCCGFQLRTVNFKFSNPACLDSGEMEVDLQR